MLETLPDFPQAKYLAAALWRREGQARGAALIVGAGVSTMAHTASEKTPKPPLWKELALSLGERLYPADPKLAPADALRLAQEYLSYFGQAALNAHLRERIADSAWFPSSTHKRLLQLPWADVLTTNYDTLLERAATEVLTPAYDVVKSAKDLVHARQPRIVKLHGSIGDDSPMVLTEEDYRNYPIRNAAMVNLARQVFIENELCLLGFSGDDPNFLQWTGWVRDNLQGAHRKIYLTVILRLSPSARRLLEERNIAPIDLAPLVEDRPKSEQHAAATEIFLEFLEISKPPPAHKWNLSNQEIYAFIQADNQADRDRLAAREKLLIRTKQWRDERLQYPGWAVCPDNYRDRLKRSCLSANLDMRRAIGSMEGNEKAAFFIEFSWRCRTALCRASDEQIQFMENFVLENESDVLSASQVECALLLLTCYRDAGDSSKFDIVEVKLQNSRHTADQTSHLNYERALRARDFMRLEELRKLLESVDGEDPMWKLRRAALACELNMWGYVRQQWLQAAIDIRKREQADRYSIWIRSRAALLEFVSMIDWDSRGEVGFADSRMRSIQNRISHCDPWEHTEIAREEVQRIRDERRESRHETLRAVSSTGEIKTRRGYADSVIARAWELRRELQRWEESAGIPNRFKETSLGHLHAESLTLAPEPSLTYALLLVRGIHGFKDRYIDKNFTRLNIVNVPRSVRIEVTSTLVSACKFWSGQIFGLSDEDALHANQENLGNLMSILGRFILSADSSIANVALDFAFELAERNREIEWRQYEALGELFKGAISALPTHDATLVFRCASIPLPSELGSDVMQKHWPNPAQWLSRIKIDKNAHISPLARGRIDHLLMIARRSNFDRIHALVRLNVVLKLGLLDAKQKKDFGEALWSNIDDGNPPLPIKIPFRIGALKNLPSPESVDVLHNIRERVFKGLEFSRKEDESILEMIAAVTGPRPVLPTASVAVELMDNLLQLHPRLRIWLEGPIRDSTYRMQERGIWLGLVIGRALVPAMDPSNLTLERLEKLLKLMDEASIASAVISLPYFASVLPTEAGRLVYRIQVALLDTASGNIARGAEAVQVWLGNVNLRDCLSRDQIHNFREVLLIALEISSGQSEPEVLRAARCILEMDPEPAYARRLADAINLILRRTRADQVLLGAVSEASFAEVRAEAIRTANTLLSAGLVECEELNVAIRESCNDPLPEVRYALSN